MDRQLFDLLLEYLGMVDGLLDELVKRNESLESRVEELEREVKALRQQRPDGE
ncbi:MAG TPA: hypothetical protein PLD20_25625 [Blastocatellia bacterium]|nr:hypothetical protein [Blastocatellia bacterium]HMV84310.1 hypothetical protein [Blastocatellia bacterium]HMX30458.1 hypothetical protein [Blastocatellia bacterium]HMZ21338.1 hypothetical protein [Blastocatellia bacterium]HNG34538.1 hypothetical protein [Blastocatellia bacterium]